MEYQHGGDVYSNRVELDFSANINPLGMPEGVKMAMIGAMEECARYPDSSSRRLKAAISACHEVSENKIICGNGAADLIFTAVQAVRPRCALLISPSFLEYEQALKSVNCRIEWFDLKEENDFHLSVPELLAFLESLEASLEKAVPDMIFLCNPNNPTGFAMEKERLKPLLDYCESRKILVLMDECFNEFLDEPERFSLLEEVQGGKWKRLFILKAFTKIYAMAGIRLGYGMTADQELLEAMERCRQPWSVSTLAQAAGEAALRETEYIKETKSVIGRERSRLREMLRSMGFYVYDSMANYVFFRDCDALSAEGEEIPAARPSRGRLYEECLSRGLLIRSCWNYRGLDNRYYRVCVRTEKENDRLLSVLRAVLEDRRNIWQSQL